MKTPRGKDRGTPKGEDLIREAERGLADAAEAARRPADSADAGVVGGLRSLVGVCRQISSIVELRPLLAKIVDEILLLSDTERGFIMLYEGDGNLSFGLGRTRAGTDLEAQEFKISMSTAASVAETAAPVIAAGPEALRAIRDKKSVVDLGLKTIICVPLRAPGGIQGVLYADSRSAVPELTTVKTEIVNAFAEQAAVAIENAKQYDRLRESKRELERQYDRLRREMKRGSGLGPIIGRSAGMLELFDKIEKVAGTDAAVLIEGETGTGKELVARTIHDKSARRGGPFIAVNCGAIPEGIMESELFGHKRGAFTGAVLDREGVFEAANCGTLLLDEISEMQQHLQVKLLRALQEGKITRVGESTTRSVDVRLISATNRNLEEEMAKGRFRTDLYYRLHVVLLRIPPLRDRGNDILLLAQHFLDSFADGMGRGPRRIAPETAEALLAYRWEGNVRELENLVERMVLLRKSDTLTVADLPADFGTFDPRREPPRPEGGSHLTYHDAEKKLILEALDRFGWNKSRAAKYLEIPRHVLLYRIKKYGLNKGEAD